VLFINKPIYVLAAGVILAAILFLGTPLHSNSNLALNPVKAEADMLTDLQSGDFVFRRGQGLWSPLFAQSSDSGFSHVGIINIENQNYFVLHSEADDVTLQGGVTKTPLSQFIAESDFYAIKHNQMPAQSKQRFINQLNTLYQQGAEFDSDYRLDNGDNRLYCTEYVWKAANNVGITLAQPIHFMGNAYITLDALIASPYLN
jgi:hypothetical protein